MKRALATGATALALASVVLLLRAEDPRVAPAPVPVTVPPATSEPTTPAAALTPKNPPEPLDAGAVAEAAPLEVTFELFDEKGHVAGANLRLLPVGETRRALASVTANVMGFARTALKAGQWEVEGDWEPFNLEVRDTQTAFVLHAVERRAVSGMVLDAAGQGVAGAVVRSSDRQRIVAGPDGRFSLSSTASTLVLQAELIASPGGRLGRRGSLPQRISLPATVSPPATELRLQLMDAAWIHASAACGHAAFWQLELGDAWVDVERDAIEEGLAVVPGVVALRVRCARDEGLAQGGARFTLAAGGSRMVRVELSPVKPLCVRLIEAHGVALPGVAVVAIPQGRDPGAPMHGSADSQGEVRLLPTQLRSFDPVYRLEAQGPWRNAREVRAALGDAPVQLDVVPSAP